MKKNKKLLGLVITYTLLAPSIVMAGDIQMSLPGTADNLVIDQSGTELMRITGEGKMGIGIANPFAKLHTSGGDILTSSSSYPGLYTMNTTKTDGVMGRTWGWLNYGGGLYLNGYGSTGSTSYAPGSPINAMFIEDGTGNIGIGTHTPNFESGNDSSKYLTIATKDNTNVNNSARLELVNTREKSALSAGQQTGRIAFNASNNGNGVGTGNIVTSAIVGLIDGTETANGFGGKLGFYTKTDSATGTAAPKMVIDHNGNVGVGITTPAVDLHVNKASGDLFTFMQANTGDSWNYALADSEAKSAAIGTYAGPAYKGGIWMGYFGESYPSGVQDVFGSSPAGWSVLESRSASAGHNGMKINERANKPIAFGTNDTEQMRITETGNVGIGTAIPTEKLEVIGNAKISQALHVNQGATGGTPILAGGDDPFIRLVDQVGTTRQSGLHLETLGGNWYLMSGLAGSTNSDFYISRSKDNSDIKFSVNRDTGNVGIGVVTSSHPLELASGAHVTSAGVWTNASDISKKENIKTISYGLDTVMALKPSEYDYKNDGSHSIGFIAQNIEQHIPEVVSGKEGSKGVAYGSLTAVLVKAMQEQQVTIEEMKKEIESLKNNQ